MTIPPYFEHLVDRTSIQRVCTTKNAEGKRITEDYKNTERRIPGTHDEEYRKILITASNTLRKNRRKEKCW